MFLYPAVSDNITALNTKKVLLGSLSVIFYILYMHHNYHREKNKAGKRIIFLWFSWGSFVYLITLSAYMLFDMFGINILEHFGQPPLKTSKIIIYLGTVCMAFLILAPILSMKSDKSFKAIFKAFVILLSIVVIEGYIHYYTGFNIIKESYSKYYIDEKRMITFSTPDPHEFGVIMNFPILLLICYFLARSRRKNYLYIFILVVSFGAILLTFARSNYISIIVGMFFLILLNKIRVATLMRSIIVIFLLILTIYHFSIPSYFQSVPRLAHPIESLEGRKTYQLWALKLVNRNPLFGAFPGRHIEIAQAEGYYGMRSTHSLYLHTATDFGIPMFLILIIVLIYSFLTGLVLLKKNKRILSLKENFYIKILLISSTAFTISIATRGLVEGVGYEYIFLNLGFILASKNLLIKKSKYFNNDKKIQSRSLRQVKSSSILR